MAVTMKNVRAALDPEEPDYAKAAALGGEAMPHLRVLVAGDDPMLASKAAHLASLIGGDGTADVLLAAARSPHDAVRVAAAVGASDLGPAEASAVLSVLVADDHPAVRARARAAVPPKPSRELAQQLERSAEPGVEGGPAAPESIDVGRPMPGESGTGGMPGEGGGMPGEGAGMPGEEMPGQGTMPG